MNETGVSFMLLMSCSPSTKYDEISLSFRRLNAFANFICALPRGFGT